MENTLFNKIQVTIIDIDFMTEFNMSYGTFHITINGKVYYDNTFEIVDNSIENICMPDVLDDDVEIDETFIKILLRDKIEFPDFDKIGEQMLYQFIKENPSIESATISHNFGGWDVVATEKNADSLSIYGTFNNYMDFINKHIKDSSSIQNMPTVK